ncbi:nodal modulator 1-like [Mya arenaria]|uniref:nodal modulator 1-like n=1 Tax=Mya arenaria TaxID=6604 RepID=UPI0022E21BB5|nr:nodal modulator 1-like [Mya arenaria]
MKNIIICLIFCKFFITGTIADVLGCGGFVKSDVEINFSLVEIKLYTPHKSIKYQTDCAPNTGYYLIPLYDKGDFVLKVEPPAGWSFEPESVELHVDGEKDPCSLGQDINFVFTGFSLNGKVVSKGQKFGPEGVLVNLFKAGSKDILQSTKTTQDGSYQFTKVLPGKYDVRASSGKDQKYRFEKSEVSVEIGLDNGDAGSSLVIAGYSVSGLVYSEGEPIKGVNFLLYSTTVNQKDVLECDKSAMSGMGKSDKPLCHVTSDASGKFTFPCLVTGDYYLIPFYKGEHITFDVEPEKLPFQVGHSDLQLEQTFQVAGFSVTGQVVDSPKGKGIGGVTVLLNGEAVKKTGPDGLYHLENMKTGMYRLNMRAENLEFEEQNIRITPNTPQLPDIIPARFNLCGKVTINKFPEGLSTQTIKRKMIIFPEGKGSAAVSKETGEDGRFCSYVAPGKYVVRVHLSDAEIKAGLTIAPVEQLVTITNKPILDLVFSQFRAKVTGSVTCIEKCGPIEISLDAVGRSDKQIAQTQGNQKTSTFTFENVLPGKYKATVLRDSLCWEEKTLELEVTSKNDDSLSFLQTGYILKCTISHSTTLNFSQDKKADSVGSFELNKGKNRFCLAQPGVYQLRPDSCHKFEKDVYNYDTSNPETLTMTAVSHLALGTVSTDQPVNDAMVTIESSLGTDPTTLGPLTLEKAAGNASQAKEAQVYKFSYWAKTGESVKVSVKSSEMLYSPPVLQISISGEVCPGEVFKFKGERGQFIVGHVTPPLSGVKVTVTDSQSRMEPVVAQTSDKGDFKIGPLHKGFDYVVSAEKEGYVMEKEEGEMAAFRARQLSRIDVKIADEEGGALDGVLLSLSGEKQYRSNNLTRDDGTMTFIGLSPGQYFLRPMMKEYKFEPVSRVIEVTEGTAVNIDIKGVRTAYSCYGMVTSLNGEPESGLFVEALGQGDCSMYQEESKTEQTGHYRIRGLQPNCTYEIRLKIGEMNKHIERAAPKSRFVVVENSDFTGVNIIAFRRMNQMDISGNVITDPEYLNTLKVRLYREDNPNQPMTTVSLGVVSFFYLPSLQMDESVYYVKLDSTLAKSSYEFDQPEIELTANISYKHITFSFNPKRKSLEQELSQSSVLMLPFTILVIFAIYNYQKLLPFALQMWGQAQLAIQRRQNPGMHQHQQHHQQPQQQYAALHDFDDSPVYKKKPKPRKT